MTDNIVNGILESYVDNGTSINGEMIWSEYTISDGNRNMMARNSIEAERPYMIVSILKFSTSAFSGKSEYLKFIFEGSQYGANPANLRFSICTSSINRDAYTTSFNPLDQHRIAQTDVSVYLPDRSAGYGETFTVQFNTTKIKPNTTYYLVFQVMNTPTDYTGVADAFILDMANYAAIEIGYNSSLVYIENGASFDTYQCFIDSGITFELYQPYIDIGTTWEPL